MKVFEAGIVDAFRPYSIHWTGETVTAENSDQAEEEFTLRGFYRNLVVREVQ